MLLYVNEIVKFNIRCHSACESVFSCVCSDVEMIVIDDGYASLCRVKKKKKFMNVECDVS